jgi:hypothetical protein
VKYSEAKLIENAAKINAAARLLQEVKADDPGIDSAKLWAVNRALYGMSDDLKNLTQIEWDA